MTKSRTTADYGNTGVDKTSTQTLSGKTLTAPTFNNATTNSPTEITPYLTSPKEKSTIIATVATGTHQFDCLTQGILYFTGVASANFALNIRGLVATSLDSLMAIGDTWSILFLVTQGATPYYLTSITVDTSATVTLKWAGGSAPTTGNASSVDSYNISVFKTAAATFTVFAGGAGKNT